MNLSDEARPLLPYSAVFLPELVTSCSLIQSSTSRGTTASPQPQESPTIRPLKKRNGGATGIDDSIDDSIDDGPANGDAFSEKEMETRQPKKRKSGVITPPPSPKRTKKCVTWNDQEGNSVHSQQDPKRFFSSTEESDSWYASQRKSYKEFLSDRVKSLIAHNSSNSSNSNNSGSGSSSYCVRGLEVFQDQKSNAVYHSKNTLHHAAIVKEQARQEMLGIKDPERLRFLSAPQSGLALRQAQKLAAQDERDAYLIRTSDSTHRHIGIDRRGRCDSVRLSSSNACTDSSDSSLSSCSTTRSSNSTESYNSADSLFSHKIRKMQERNASRLMRIYRRNDEFRGEDNLKYLFQLGTNSCDSSLYPCSTTRTSNSTESYNSADSLLTNKIRKLQEKNARRLMRIYHPNNEFGGEDNVSNLFRFVRREDLVGIRNDGMPVKKLFPTVPSTMMSKNVSNCSSSLSNGSDGNFSGADTLTMMHRRSELQQTFQQQVLSQARAVVVDSLCATSGVTPDNPMMGGFYLSRQCRQSKKALQMALMSLCSSS
eukprot:jgi/Psemu1/326306/estExt_fgenesh1_pg.C_3620001